LTLFQDQEIEITGQTGPTSTSINTNGDHIIKTEPGLNESSSSTLPIDPSGLADPSAEVVNTLEPKKKARKRRAPSEDDMPAPPPPMKTIRLTIDLSQLKTGVTIEYNVLDNAKELGMVDEWPMDLGEREVKGDDLDGEDGTPGVDGEIPGGVPKAPPPVGLRLDEDDAIEIARRLEEKYGDKKPAKKVRPSVMLFEDPCLVVNADRGIA